MFKFSDIISKWTISTDCKDNLANDMMAWVKKAAPIVIMSKRKNPIKEPPDLKDKGGK